MAPYSKNNLDRDLEIGLYGSEITPTASATNKSTSLKKSWWRIPDDKGEGEKTRGCLYYFCRAKNNLAMAPLSLAVVILAGRALATYKRHKHVQHVDLAQAWPDDMVLGDLNAMLGTAVVMLFLSFFGGLLPFALDDVIMLIAFSFVMLYLWGHDVFGTGLFDMTPYIRSNLREWVCFMDEIVFRSKAQDPYGKMCSDLVS